MEKVKADKGKGKNFRWSKSMSDMLLQILAEEAQKGNRPSSTFKPESFERVAKAINERFAAECQPTYVISHLKTIKANWKMISTLKEKSGFGWNEGQKMITVDCSAFAEEIMAHPGHEKFLNKTIENYDNMKIVAGNDMATCSFAKTFEDVSFSTSIGNETVSIGDDDDMEEVSRSKGKLSTNSRKRERDDDLSSILDKIDVIAAAIEKLEDTKPWIPQLHEEVRKIKSFDIDTLDSIVDYLILNELMARSFIANNEKEKERWIRRFKIQQRI